MTISLRQKQRGDFAKNFAKQLKINNKTQNDIAIHFNLTRSTVNSWYLGKAIPRDEMLLNIAEYFDTTVADLLMDHETLELYNLSSNVVEIPILGRINCGNPSNMIEEIIGYEEIPTKLSKTGEFFGLKARGDSMSPDIKNNDILIVRKQANVENGEIAIICISNDDAVCKKIVKNEFGIALVPLNSNYEQRFYSNDDIKLIPLKIIGRVIEIRRKY